MVGVEVEEALFRAARSVKCNADKEHYDGENDDTDKNVHH
jgi:hypothetical protein